MILFLDSNLGTRMSKMDQNTIKNLARLCRIECDEEESKELVKDLQRILEYVEQLQEINTEHVEPCYHVLSSIVNVMREDIPGISMPREVFLKNAPAQVGGMIRVPPILKQH
jgi:aspartyl-tRNA(Asn)/glutamyl-tRNA(Gln) amidotransferase subunit C